MGPCEGERAFHVVDGHQRCGLYNVERREGLGLTRTQKAQFEAVARNEYTKGDTKNPVDCSIFYLALRKKAVLQGLWRMATGNKEQTATKKFLANNFDDPKWRTAALKNAYALLSKRRFGRFSPARIV